MTGDLISDWGQVAGKAWESADRGKAPDGPQGEGAFFPVYGCEECGEQFLADPRDKCPHCGGPLAFLDWQQLF